MADEEYGPDNGPDNGGEQGGATTERGDGDSKLILGIKMDTRYPRSIEGILRIITVPVTALGLIFVIASLFSYTGGWFFFVGFWYIVYVVVVFVIEICIPLIYVHRLIDAIIVFAYAGLFMLSAVLNMSFGIAQVNVVLGLSALCAFICSGLCIAQGVFALMTWRTYEQGKGGSKPIFALWW